MTATWPGGALPGSLRGAEAADGWVMRSAEPAELPALQALEQACFPDPWSLDALRWGLGERDAMLPLICARRSPRRVLAYLLLRHHAGEAEILRLAVAPAKRRSGLAAALLDTALAALRARGIRRCVLEVRAANRAALALYGRFGFAVVGRRVGYYPDGSDAIVCARNLARPVSLNPPRSRCYGDICQDRDAAAPPEPAAGASGNR